MKRDPISNRERPRIVHQVAAGQEWQGKRSGCRIRIRRQAQLNLTAEPISWMVCLRRRWNAGFASTVTAAVEAVNRFIQRGGPAR